LALAVLVANLSGTAAWFKEQAGSQVDDIPIKRTLILKTKDGVTLGQLQKAADYMLMRKKAEKLAYFYVKPEHIRPIKYILSQKKEADAIFETLVLNENPNAQYFAIIPSHSEPKETLEKKYETAVEILSGEKCGQISVYEIDFPERVVSKEFRYNKKYSPTDRIFWKDIFKLKQSSVEIEKDDEVMEEIDMNE
jgi:hypothetical protein